MNLTAITEMQDVITKHFADSLEKLLREGETPIIARIKNDKVVFDPRTLMKGDMEIITDRLESIALKTEK